MPNYSQHIKEREEAFHQNYGSFQFGEPINQVGYNELKKFLSQERIALLEWLMEEADREYPVEKSTQIQAFLIDFINQERKEI